MVGGAGGVAGRGRWPVWPGGAQAAGQGVGAGAAGGPAAQELLDDRRARRPGQTGRPAAVRQLLQPRLPPDWDRLGTQAKARAWLRQKGLVGPDVRVSAADAARLRKLREAIRALAIANHGGRPDPVATATIRGASHTARLRVAVDAGRTVLEPDRPGVDGAVATLLGILREAQLTGCGRG